MEPEPFIDLISEGLVMYTSGNNQNNHVKKETVTICTHTAH